MLEAIEAGEMLESDTGEPTLAMPLKYATTWWGHCVSAKVRRAAIGLRTK